MRLLIHFLFICCLCLCLGCDVIYHLLDKEGAEEKKLIGEVVPFEKNPTIEEIQALLTFAGYNPGKIDGILGGRTRQAIVRFQKDYGLKETRFVDNETWEKLRILKVRGLVVENKLNVRFIQRLLKDAGYNPGEVDGKLGPKTIAALKKFQSQQDLKVDGKIGYKTLTKLIELIPAN